MGGMGGMPNVQSILQNPQVKIK